MEHRRLMTVTAAVYGTLVLTSWAISKLPAFAPAGIESSRVENSRPVPVADRVAPALMADAGRTDAPQAVAVDHAAVARDDAATAVSETKTAADTAAVAEESKPVLAATSPDLPAPDLPDSDLSRPDLSSPDSSRPDLSRSDSPSPALPQAPTEAPVQLATANTPDPGPDEIKAPPTSADLPDPCLLPDSCVDGYLWALYQRTPKDGVVKVPELRQVTVKRKGKTVTVTRTFAKVVDEDFGWKDPKAAEKSGMAMKDYVIGGMDATFKRKLYNMLRAAQQAGLSPGITSAFRDDYRQSIATGLKAATNRSYHGGSSRGGYGHGLAADVVSTHGATRDERWAASSNFWKWIDAHGSEFGIGRPYLGRDPPHVAPTDGQEYAAHHPVPAIRLASADKKPSRVVARAVRTHTAAKAQPAKKRKLAALQRG